MKTDALVYSKLIFTNLVVKIDQKMGKPKVSSLLLLTHTWWCENITASPCGSSAWYKTNPNNPVDIFHSLSIASLITEGGENRRRKGLELFELVIHMKTDVFVYSKLIFTNLVVKTDRSSEHHYYDLNNCNKMLYELKIVIYFTCGRLLVGCQTRKPFGQNILSTAWSRPFYVRWYINPNSPVDIFHSLSIASLITEGGENRRRKGYPFL
jgi:hypothetical protein